MKHLYFLCILNSALCIILSGCGDSSRPKDLPKLYPCTVTVKQDGKPLSGAAVVLVSLEPDISKWAASGLTDAEGNAVLKTHGRYSGAVQGTFKVLITKVEVEKAVIIQEETATTPEKSIPGKTYTLVDTAYGDIMSTPLTITINGGKNEAVFDAGSAVKKEIKSN